MSEYQYYEFCSLHSPLSAAARKEMEALSSRTRVGTHNASYVYHYGDFRGNVEENALSLMLAGTKLSSAQAAILDSIGGDGDVS